MSEPTLDNLRVPEFVRIDRHTVMPQHRRLTPAEFDRIATERGYVKRPVCGTCKGKPLAEGEYWDGQLPNGDEPDFDGPCPSCGGTGFGRLYVGRCSECGGDLIRCVRVWAEGKKCCPDCVHPQVLDALDGGQE